MQNEIFASLRRLSDHELVAGLKSLAARERNATAHIVAHLAELDTRDVHLREGYPSLFAYCRDVVSLSEAEAFNRIEVARAARRFPVILEMLVADAIHLTTVRLLAPHLTVENHREVLESARGKKKVEVEQIVVRLAPRPDVPTSFRKLPAPGTESALPSREAVSVSPAAPATAAPCPGPSAASAASAAPVRPAAATPLSSDRYKLQLTIAGETLEKLRLAQDMLSHTIPSGDDGAILDRALTLLVEDLARKKFADTRTPRPATAVQSGTRHIRAAVKRAVWLRDRGRCAFVGKTGHRCDARRFIEFHHVDPYSLGGETSVDLISLRCRSHNEYEGRLYFGKRRPEGHERSFRNESAGQSPDATIGHTMRA